MTTNSSPSPGTQSSTGRDEQPTESARIIQSRTHELSPGFSIRRALPTREQRMIGAWCFLDHIGPAKFDFSGELNEKASAHRPTGMHVGAHPHIGLQTFTWMLEGQIRHRDSLGYNQVIRPGQVNLMTAGKGVSHTEDSLPGETHLHGAQLWIALPPEKETIAPAFQHYSRLPEWRAGGLHYTLLAGQFKNQTSPVEVHSPLLGLDVFAPNGGATAVLPLNPTFEHGIMVLNGEVQLISQTQQTQNAAQTQQNGIQRITPGALAYWPPGINTITVYLSPGTRLLLIGGHPFPEPVKMWWNFVSASTDNLRQAVRDWNEFHPRFGVVRTQNHRRLISPNYPGT
ncbi:MAG: quercetin 2,3-dioxygenase [Pusillimonas sp.]|nr:quercetin 2,3-dioxygenase [Pusillimonas sp.]